MLRLRMLLPQTSVEIDSNLYYKVTVSLMLPWDVHLKRWANKHENVTWKFWESNMHRAPSPIFITPATHKTQAITTLYLWVWDCVHSWFDLLRPLNYVWYPVQLPMHTEQSFSLKLFLTFFIKTLNTANVDIYGPDTVTGLIIWQLVNYKKNLST